jgi:hypothetical protein
LFIGGKAVALFSPIFLVAFTQQNYLDGDVGSRVELLAIVPHPGVLITYPRLILSQIRFTLSDTPHLLQPLTPLRYAPPREAREGWPLLIVETEVNWDSDQRGPFLLVRCTCRAGTRDICSALAALVGPVKSIFSHRTLFQFLCPHRPASWASRRAGSPVSCVPGRTSRRCGTPL